jgi:hypothetical protein
VPPAHHRQSDELELAARRHGDGENEQHEYQTDGQITIVQRAVQQPAEVAVAQCVEATFEALAKTRRTLAPLMRQRMIQALPDFMGTNKNLKNNYLSSFFRTHQG